MIIKLRQSLRPGIIVFLILICSCKQNAENHLEHDSASYYTCPMHPSVVSKTPGVCPVCNMSLIKVDKAAESNSDNNSNIVILDARQQQLAGIITDTVKLNVINSGTDILGRVSLDETLVTSISSRVSGRIDNLLIRASGEFIQKGRPLYRIYSEELLADEKEFILLAEKVQLNQNPSLFLEELLVASRNKLILWGLNSGQITELTRTKSVSPQITFYSPMDGYVTDVLITEGVYVKEGTPILKIASLSHVWVEAQIYSNESINSKIFKIVTSTSSDETYEGQVVYSNPVLEADRKFQLLRIKVENTKGKLIPGMMVYVSALQSNKMVLSVPESAILLEKMKTVWIKIDETTFEQRMVKTGSSNENLVEILSGVKENEIVVSSGAYLINSEFILKSGSGQRHNH